MSSIGLASEGQLGALKEAVGEFPSDESKKRTKKRNKKSKSEEKVQHYCLLWQ